MRCPLPVDWLEFLEGTPSEELESHLRECRPCQLLVGRIKRDLPSRTRALSLRVSKLDQWPRWHEEKRASPAFGQIWWSIGLGKSLAFAELLRVPLLVLSNLWHEAGHSWCEVAPIATDIENATSLDIVLNRSDSDLDVPWRVLLRYQTVVNRNDLDSRIGVLAEPARVLVGEVMKGRAPEDRFGSPIEGPDDSRLEASEPLARSMEILGRAYAMLQEKGEQEEEAAHTATRIATFTMRVPPPSARVPERFALAAATTAEDEAAAREVMLPGRGRFLGRIEYRLSNDRLVFVIDEVEEKDEGFTTPMRIVLWSARLPSPQTSGPFIPRVSEELTLTSGFGILPSEITRLEVRISDEV